MQQSPFFKFLSIAVIWIIVAVITIAQFAMRLGSVWFLTLGMFGIAAGVTASILNDGNGARNRTVIQGNTDDITDRSSRKPKNDQAGGLTPDMLALLDEDDIAELRQRVKTRLMERIEGGSDGELSSLDALLAEQDAAPRKNRR